MVCVDAGHAVALLQQARESDAVRGHRGERTRSARAMPEAHTRTGAACVVLQCASPIHPVAAAERMAQVKKARCEEVAEAAEIADGSAAMAVDQLDLQGDSIQERKADLLRKQAAQRKSFNEFSIS